MDHPLIMTTLARSLGRVALIGAAVLGCDPSGTTAAKAASPSGPSARTAAPARSATAGDGGIERSADRIAGRGADALVPLRAAAPLIELPIEGEPAAVVSLPIGATARRPVIIASHGNYDRPEWQCQVWREIVGDDAFILCPRGVARPDSPSADDVRFTYESNARLEREIDGGLKALVARFPAHVDGASVLYTGFSLGAIMGVSIASRRPALFPRLVLIEGGHDKWTAAAAKAFSERGGQRVLFVCAQAGCGAAAKSAAARLVKAGLAARVVRAKEVGHRYDGPVADETKRSLAWVLEGDPRWAAP
jgi:hypothetical protein